MNNILVVAAHPDDEILGLGGTIRKKIEEGSTVNCLILGEGVTSRRGSKTDKDVEMLHEDAINAAKSIGFNNIYFENLPDNRFDSLAILDIIQKIEGYIDSLKPQIVYTHHKGDRNVDHRIAYDAVITACRPVGNYTVREIYAFETPSSTEWGFNGKAESFFPNVFVDITSTIDKKIEALNFYDSEMREFPHPRSIEAIKLFAQRWGTVIGKEYVEAFELILRIE